MSRKSIAPFASQKRRKRPSLASRCRCRSYLAYPCLMRKHATIFIDIRNVYRRTIQFQQRKAANRKSASVRLRCPIHARDGNRRIRRRVWNRVRNGSVADQPGFVITEAVVVNRAFVFMSKKPAVNNAGTICPRRLIQFRDIVSQS